MSSRRKTKASPIVHQDVAQFYDRFVDGIKERIRTAQVKAALAANAQLVLHYWEIGRDILASQKREGWGAKVIDRLANDLQREFPKLSGYSARNLKYMRAFVQLRRLMDTNRDLARKIEALAKKYDEQHSVRGRRWVDCIGRLVRRLNDWEITSQFADDFAVIKELVAPEATPRKSIGFHL